MASCVACGSQLLIGAAFCGNCGAPAPAAAQAGPPADAAKAPTIPPTDPATPLAAASPTPSSPPAAARRTQLGPGTLVDKKYSIVRVLGEGGMGVVYLARDVHTGLDVVVKAVRSEYAHRADVRQRTLAEGRALAQIDHPNVVHLKAVVVEDESLLLVMQYIDGENLDSTIERYVERGERMPLDEALTLLRQIAAGVGAAHKEGVIHRDLKPANVLIRKKDHVAKVTDFGISKSAADSDRAQTKGIIGSLWYMSPEQVTGRRDLDARSDIYALGVVLYQMLTGQVPFDAESDYEIMRLHAEGPMPRAAAVRPDVPAAVDDIIQRACAKDRAQRFQSCDELIAALDRVTSTSAPPRAATAPAMPIYVAPPPMPQVAPPPMPHAAPPPMPHYPTAPITAQGTALPSEPQRASGGWIAAAVGIGLVVGLGVLFVTGTMPGLGPSTKGTTSSGSAEHMPGTPPPPPSGTQSAQPKKSPLEALTGAWVANGKALDAVLVGDTLEFRIKEPSQFAPQDYEAGEARFVLRTTNEPNVFSAEDRIRPLPPAGKTYDPRSRSTCQELWSAAGGTPLEARYDGSRLTVEFAKIEPTLKNFVLEGSRVVSCRGLRDLEAGRVVSTLTRP